MPKWKVVLADSDELYIDNLCKFIRNGFSSRFNLNVFTHKTVLADFLADCRDKTDILLTSPDMVPDAVGKLDIGATVLLTDGRSGGNEAGLPAIHKYQPGDTIVNELLEIYAAVDPDACGLMRGGRRTKVVTVFSPQGGSGKSLISVCLARQLSGRGCKVFYLNLETLSATSLLLDSANNEKGLSYLLYYIKENRGGLAARLENAKSFDAELGISFFRPADAALELEDLTETDAGRLLYELASSGQYDVIVVDTESGFHKRNLAMLEAGDAVLMILGQDTAAKHKLELFDRELEKSISGGKGEFYARVIPVINKYDAAQAINMDAIPWNGKAPAVKIPYLSDIFVPHGEGCKINPESSLNTYVLPLVQRIADSTEKKAARS